MAEENTRRRDVATATTGATMLGAGGVMRHAGVKHAFGKKPPKIHALGMVKAPHGKRLFWGGSAIGLIGLPPLAVGTTRLAQGSKVDKADDSKKRGFWREGLSGTREALGQRADSYRQPVPAKVRAAQLGIGTGFGAVGSVAARAALGRRGNAFKPLLTPVAGGLAATASIPLTNRALTHRKSEFEVTAAGVRRRKKDPVKPSKYSSQARQMPRSLQQDVGKADDTRYRGARTPYGTQRAAITAATHTPVVGPFAGAAAAGRYAPPGQQRKQAVRQYAMSSGAALPAGVAGAYGGAALANRSERAHRAASKLVDAKTKVEGKARRVVGLGEKKPGRISRTTDRLLKTKAGKPFRTPKGAIGGMAGFAAARAVAGGIGDQAAISLNQRDQRRYNTAHSITKAMTAPPTKREKHDLARKKRRSAVLSELSGSAGLGSLGLLAARKKEPAILLGTIGSGVGGTNALLGAQVQRQEAKAVDPIKKRDYSRFWEAHRAARKLAVPKPRVVHLRLDNGKYACGAKHVPSMSPGNGGYVTGRLAPASGPTMRRNAEPTSSSKYVHNVTCATCKNTVGATAASEETARAAETARRKATSHSSSQAAREKRTGQHRALQSIQESWFQKGLVPGTREWFLPKQGMVRSGGKWLSVYKDRENPTESVHYIDPDDLEVLQWTRDRSKAHRSRPGSWTAIARTKNSRLIYQSKRRNDVAKAAALQIQGSKKEHEEMIRRYGDRGPLPKTLSREDRMKAYEARYVHHGGDRQNAWSRRAKVGEGLKNAGLGVGTAGGAAWLATRGKRGAKLLAKHPRFRSHAETTAVAGATLGGAGEMLAGYAHRKQSSYANSPGGVAASALRRMRDYTPEGQQ